ncbi:MAG: acyl-CoA thioesterase [Candidatus Margulisiibacteriota bacterium]
MEKEFVFEKTAYLHDTNLFGNVYFARYFEWQGMAREEFFRQVMPNIQQFLKSGIRLVTIDASMQYKKEVTLFDQVLIKLAVDNLKISTFDLIFTFVNKNTNDVIATGKQKIGFTDALYKVIPIPDEFKMGWEKLTKNML